MTFDVDPLLRLQGTERILFIRSSAIGDIVMASPAVTALKAAHPNLFLAWIVEPYGVQLLKEHPAVDAVIPWPKEDWERLIRRGKLKTLAREIQAFRNRLRSFRFHMALDAQGLLKSRMLAKLSGAPTRIGFVSKEPNLGLMTRIISRGPSTKILGSEYWFLISLLGVFPSFPEDAFPIPDPAWKRAREVLKRNGIRPPYVVLAPFTTRPQKHWIESRWIELGRRIEKRWDLDVVVLGGPGDSISGNRMIQRSDGTLKGLFGKTSLMESAAVIRESAGIVGVDTGLTHMGMVLRRPTVALFGATCPYLHPGFSKGRVLIHRLPCSPCKRRPSCDGRFDCMERITVDEVWQTLEQFDLAGRVQLP